MLIELQTFLSLFEEKLKSRGIGLQVPGLALEGVGRGFKVNFKSNHFASDGRRTIEAWILITQEFFPNIQKILFSFKFYAAANSVWSSQMLKCKKISKRCFDHDPIVLDNWRLWPNTGLMGLGQTLVNIFPNFLNSLGGTSTEAFGWVVETFETSLISARLRDFFLFLFFYSICAY